MKEFVSTKDEVCFDEEANFIARVKMEYWIKFLSDWRIFRAFHFLWINPRVR
jgi:hypothetical protein